MRFFLLLATLPALLLGGPVKYGWGTPVESQEVVTTTRDTTHEQILALRASMQNLEIETKRLKENLNTQEQTFDALREEMEKLSKFVTELKNSRESSDKYRTVEEAIAQQNRNIEAIESAMRSMMEAMGMKGAQVHVVKSGDSLGEIATRYHTSIDSLKKLNQLKNDKIVVGQKIKIQ